MNYLFSIIVPVYNVEKYLKECVESILKQTFKKYEIILVDDGSTDSSPTICDIFSKTNTNIKVIHQKNKGLSEARNIGINYATGEYLAFLDSDDYWLDEDYLMSIQFAIFNNYKPDIIINTAYKLFKEENQKSKELFSFVEIDKLNKMKFSEALYSLLKSNYFPISAWSKVIKNNIVKDVLFEPNLLSEDIDWSIKIFQKCQTFFLVNKPSYIYRMRDDSITHSIKEKTYFDLFSIINKWSIELRRGEEENLSYYLLGFLAYEFYILIGIRRLLGNIDEHTNELKKFKWLTKYSFNKKTKLCKIIIKIMGIKGASLILAKYIGRK